MESRIRIGISACLLGHRESFIEQIFTLKRWRGTLTQPANMKQLVDFHTRHKLLITRWL